MWINQHPVSNWLSLLHALCLGQIREQVQIDDARRLHGIQGKFLHNRYPPLLLRRREPHSRLTLLELLLIFLHEPKHLDMVTEPHNVYAAGTCIVDRWETRRLDTEVQQVQQCVQSVSVWVAGGGWREEVDGVGVVAGEERRKYFGVGEWRDVPVGWQFDWVRNGIW